MTDRELLLFTYGYLKGLNLKLPDSVDLYMLEMYEKHLGKYPFKEETEAEKQKELLRALNGIS